jgi:hypothetical protein
MMIADAMMMMREDESGRSARRSPAADAKLTVPSESHAKIPARSANARFRTKVGRWLRMTAFYMDAESDSIRRGRQSVAFACLAALAMTIVFTWPLVLGFNQLGRTAPGDGPYAIWNVSWVAQAIARDPLHVLDANIFYPHSKTLTYSELNLVAGLVALPGWLATKNPYVAHNLALFFAFSSSAIGAWLLARKLTGQSGAAFVAAVLYAFCPYFFAHTPHIQLLMGGGIPVALLLMYRIAEAPSVSRGVMLGVALAAQALACAYYGIFAGLIVAYSAVFFAFTRLRLRDGLYWISVAVGAGLSILLVLPFFLPFIELQQEGFRRQLQDSVTYSANLTSYFASGAHAHRWLLSAIRDWPRFIEVLFPGLLALVLAPVGIVAMLRTVRPHEVNRPNPRETLWLFGSLGILAVWASFGPAAGLYTVLYYAIPPFSFLRAPSRFGPVIMLSLAVFGAFGARELIERLRLERTVSTGALLALAVLDLNQVPFHWERAPALPTPYAMLAQLPPAPLAEFPFYGERIAFHLHTRYMLFSTAHWFPLVNGYSDHIPADFREAAVVLDSFPSDQGFNVLKRRRVRYIAVHWDLFGSRRGEIEERLRAYAQHLRPLAADPAMTLYEVVFYP